MPGSDALIVGRYRLVRQLAVGGMGTVWEGWDQRLMRPVAIKQLHAHLTLSSADAELAKNRAMREGRLTARLHHPHAVPVYDVVDHDGQPCLIMQYLPSISLQELVSEKGTLTPATVARIGADIASALAEAHRAGIIHRDVKPGNILIGEDGTAKITDFGISHALDDITVTSTGMVSGTPAYLAPEVARGRDSTFASDVFSLASTLCFALEGTPPFGTDSNAMAMLHRVASAEPSGPTRNDGLSEMLRRMLSTDPARRPAMVDVADRLATVAASMSASALDTDELTAVLAAAPAPPAPTADLPLPPSLSPRVAAAAPPTRPPVTPPPPFYEPPAGRPERRRSLLIPILAVLVVVVLGIVLAAVLLGQSGGGGNTAATTASTPATAKSTAKSPAKSSPTHKKTATRSSSTARSSTSASSTSRSASSTSSRPSTSASSPAPGSSGAKLAAAVNDYYALLPGNTDAGWQRLTAQYQQGHAGGRQGYQQFWDAVSSVDVSGATGSPPGQVTATVTYHYKDGRVIDELTSFDLVREQGILKIDSSTVERSVTR